MVGAPSAERRRRSSRLVAAASGLATCLSSVAGAGGVRSVAAASPSVPIVVVAAENEYGNVAAQIGGRYVHVVSIESNPNTDPHTYEVSPRVAGEVAGANIAIQNGLGYDSFMNKLESASPSSKRVVIDVQQLLRLPDGTANPHLWYDPKTMPAVATSLGKALAALRPTGAAYFRSNVKRFDNSLRRWSQAIAGFKAKHAGTAAATTEPVADYLLQAMGIVNLAPFGFQAAIMNGTDPTPQDLALEGGLLTNHKVKVFCSNQQVADSLTEALGATAHKAGVPVVGVYETMPTPGYDYQSWMLAETEAVQAAVVSGTSTPEL